MTDPSPLAHVVAGCNKQDFVSLVRASFRRVSAGAGAVVFDESASARCDALAEVVFEGLLARATVERIVNVKWNAACVPFIVAIFRSPQPPPYSVYDYILAEDLKLLEFFKCLHDVLQICKQRGAVSAEGARLQELHMSDTIFLCMLEGKLHALCAVAGISNERHQRLIWLIFCWMRRDQNVETSMMACYHLLIWSVIFILLHTSESASPPGFAAILQWAESKQVPLDGLLSSCSVGATSLAQMLGCTDDDRHDIMRCCMCPLLRSALVRNDSATIDALMSPIILAIKPQVFGLVNPLDIHTRRSQNAQVLVVLSSALCHRADTAQPVGQHEHSAAQGVASNHERNAAPAASSSSNSVVLNRAYLTPYSQIQTLQNWLADVQKQCPDWPSIFRFHNGKEEERQEQEQLMRARADQFLQDIVTGWTHSVALPPPMLARIIPTFRALLAAFLAFEVNPSGGGCVQQLLCNASLHRAMLALAAETVLLCSGRIDALYPYCVEAGGATHLDALMVAERWLQQNKMQGFLLHIHEGLQDHLKGILDAILDWHAWSDAHVLRCLDAPGWQDIVSGESGSSSIQGQHEPLHHGDIMSEHLRRAPNPRATPTMQTSNRLTFKFWSMLTGRAKQHLLQLCRQPLLCANRPEQWASDYTRACLVDFKSILADSQARKIMFKHKLDQVLMCILFARSKVDKLSPELKFRDIITSVKSVGGANGPYAHQGGGSRGNDHEALIHQVHIGDSLPPGNIIDFYNKVFVPMCRHSLATPFQPSAASRRIFTMMGASGGVVGTDGAGGELNAVASTSNSANVGSSSSSSSSSASKRSRESLSPPPHSVSQLPSSSSSAAAVQTPFTKMLTCSPVAPPLLPAASHSVSNSTTGVLSLAQLFGFSSPLPQSYESISTYSSLKTLMLPHAPHAETATAAALTIAAAGALTAATAKRIVIEAQADAAASAPAADATPDKESKSAANP